MYKVIKKTKLQGERVKIQSFGDSTYKLKIQRKKVDSLDLREAYTALKFF